ncbi:MAG: DUF3899 domain-containing protein [Ruminococcus flavefaciens]|nr:DUF3899 domain-containing protein [Ruminococcus flavefaciens]
MSEKRKAFLTSLAAGAILAAAVCALNVSRGYGLSRSVCDGFFVAAVMLLGVGAIRAINNRGAFDVAGYGLRMAVELVLPVLKREEKEDIHQYRERKEAERKSPAGLLLAGAVYLVLSLAALGVYEML